MQERKKKPSVGLGDIRKEEKVKGDSPGEGGGGSPSSQIRIRRYWGLGEFPRSMCTDS